MLAPTATRRLVNRFASRSDQPEHAGAADPTAVDAAELFLSEHTVKIHVALVLAELSLRDRVQAVVLAYETGLA